MLSEDGLPLTVKSVRIIPARKTGGPYPYYYDMEIEDGNHSYFSDGVLVHNSQFIDISPITRKSCRKENISESTLFHNLPKQVVEDIDRTTDELLDRINKNVAECVNRECHTTQGIKLHYAKEYLAAEGFYFAKKHYIVHKVFDDGKPCDKFKYSGISVKKAEIPACMKTFLKDIYESTMAKDWNESDYVKHVKKAYDTFCSLDWDDVSYYKKYQTEKAATGLCSSEKGAGVHARGANFYNNLIDKMGISGKYEKIHIGDEMRYCYVTPDNVYGMDVIAFKGKFPQEFRDIFHIDYGTMFQKIFTKSLETFVEIMKYAEFDPNKQVVFDVFG
jgi:hypothetical protein